MAGSGGGSGIIRVGWARLVLAVAVIVAAVLTVDTGAVAQIAADQRCVGCHSRPGQTKLLQDADTLSMSVPAEAYARSVHAGLGCAACHAEIKLKTHPQDRKPIATAHDYAVGAAQICGKCHDDMLREWQGSVHATLAAAGNPDAPLCTDCHDPHAQAKGVPAIEAVPCRSCHAEQFEAFAGSVHAQERAKGDARTPLCFDCHNAHAVSVASAPGGGRFACVGCHEGTLSRHRAWLPNAELHFATVSCAVCHVPEAPRRVDLRLVDDSGTMQGVPAFEPPGKGVQVIAAYNLLRDLRPQLGDRRLRLSGRLEVASSEAVHHLASKEQAVRDCGTCHSADAAAFQSVTFTMPGQDGLPLRQAVDKTVLRSASSVGPIGGFYAIGGTRIGLLDRLLGLAVLAGVGLPAAHLLLGALVRRHLRRRSAAGRARGA